MTSLKDIVRTARLEQYGMSLTEFAAAVGLSEGALASVEYGGRPSSPTVEKIAAFLRRPVSELDPHGFAVKRRAPRARELPARTSAVSAAQGHLIEQLTALFDAFTVSHEEALAAIRTDDLAALDAARRRQAELIAAQFDPIDAYAPADRRGSA